jgi:ADP-L-glycero-D-manno-heptose 6-epimerase
MGEVAIPKRLLRPQAARKEVTSKSFLVAEKPLARRQSPVQRASGKIPSLPGAYRGLWHKLHRRALSGKGRASRIPARRNGMLLVTGGAGFIGSNIVASLNEAGRSDVVVNDLLGSQGKWRNLAKRQIADFVPPEELFAWLDGRKLDAVIHMGAISDTTATDGDLVLSTNFRLSLRLLDWCSASKTPFLYASSAATYGDGTDGFADDWSAAALRHLKPMNLYGFSKHLFDLALVERLRRGERMPPQWAGLKFFNVFGPNEYHKGEMMSLVAKRFDEARAGKRVQLFRSHRDGIGDGEQKRDFIYVNDAVAVVRWLLETPKVSGIFNVGTGAARSFRDLISGMFAALGRAPDIEYVEMPPSIRGQYQYFTQAEVENLRRAGYNAGFTPLEAALKDYVAGYLDRPDRYR